MSEVKHSFVHRGDLYLTPDDFETKSDVIKFFQRYHSRHDVFICCGECCLPHDATQNTCTHYRETVRKISKLIPPKEMDRLLKLKVFGFKTTDCFRLEYNLYSIYDEVI